MQAVTEYHSLFNTFLTFDVPEEKRSENAIKDDLKGSSDALKECAASLQCAKVHIKKAEKKDE